MGGKMSRDKGARGERELAGILRGYGYDKSRRAQQYCGSETSADVLGLPGIHTEVKRTEKISLYEAMDQAKRDTGNSGDYPAVFHRRNDHNWLVIMELSSWIEIYREWEAGQVNDDVKIGGTE